MADSQAPVVTILGIQPRDIYALFEISRKNINLLVDAMNKVQLNIDRSKPEEVEQEQAFMAFYHQLNDLKAQLGRDYGTGPNSE